MTAMTLGAGPIHRSGPTPEEVGRIDSVEPLDTVDTGTPVVCGEIPTIEDGRTPSRVLTVEPGEDIAAIAATAEPGDSILLSAGTHDNAYVVDLHGTAEAPIWLGGEGAVFEGGWEGLHLVRARFVIVHDLQISGSEDNGLNADDGGDYDDEEASHHLLFRDLHFSDVGSGGNQDCLKLSGLRDYAVIDSTFERCSSSGIDHVGCHRGVIARNHFEDNGGGVQSKGGSADIEIRQNTFVDSGDRALNLGGGTGKEYFRPPLSDTEDNVEARDLEVYANHFVGSEAPIAYVGCVDCVVANNTLIEPGKWVFRILQESVSDEEHDFANNLWYAQDDPGASEPELPAEESGAVIGVDPELDGIAPTAESPALGAGTAARTDGDLEARCYLDPPAIGAMEWSGD